MPSSARLLEFALLSWALIVVPGPNVLFIVSRSLQQGRTAGVAAGIGGQLGVYLQVIAVALGVGTLVEQSAAVFTAIKLAGAGYLVYLGVQAIRHRRSLAAALEVATVKKPVSRMLTDGFVVGVTNPKVIIALVSDSIWAIIAGTARGWFARSPRRLEIIGGSSGVVMIGIGASLALTGRAD
jgi:threonine/homoserine/homoserine lactone efflux protein